MFFFSVKIPQLINIQKLVFPFSHFGIRNYKFHVQLILDARGTMLRILKGGGIPEREFPFGCQ